MGIGITSNNWLQYRARLFRVFQSPMGIGITSNVGQGEALRPKLSVSIPNGDRHYLERWSAARCG